jgi:hypothetical protein
MSRNPFGDDLSAPKRENPFGSGDSGRSPEAAAERMDQAARKIRGLRSQIGAEGLTIPATRELIDEVAAALEAGASALRGFGSP